MLCSLDPRIWAARLVTGADGVKAIKKAVRGMETMRVLTASDIHVIEHDRHRQTQTAKRKPTNVTGDVATASTAIESTSLLIPVGGDEFSEPLPAPTVPPSTPPSK